jgi:hypothetical protein
MRAADPTDPRNILTLVLFHIAAIYDEKNHGSQPVRMWDAMGAVAREPGFLHFAERPLPGGGVDRVLSAPSAVTAARAEVGAALKKMCNLIDQPGS